jgi:hypothetical protein
VSQSSIENSPKSQTGGAAISDANTQGDQLASQIPSLNMLELELLHQFATSTSQSLTMDPMLKTLWRINVPQIGFAHEFVMRSIFAISALHLAAFRPDKRDFYISYASNQHQIALRQASTLLPQVSAENSNALYIFSALTSFYILASPRKPGDILLVGDSEIAEWVYLIRGIRTIMELSGDVVLTGTLEPLIKAGQRRALLREGMELQNEHVVELARLLQSTVSDLSLLKAYLQAVEEVQKSIAVMESGIIKSYESSDVFVWVYKLPEQYLFCLRERTQEAMTIFAYYCVVLKRLDFQWWAHGWGSHLIALIYNILDQEHRLWIQWPIEEIGWVPD